MLTSQDAPSAPAPVDEEPAVPSRPKPLLRGRLHEAAFWAAIPAGIVLIVLATTTTARVAAGLFATALVLMYGVSALYHVRNWTEEGRRRIKRADHSMIYILIAGTYTPVCLLALRPPWSIALLAAVWAGAGLGIALKSIRVDGFHKLSGGLYIILGWLALAAGPAMVHRLTPTEILLLVAGGVLYTAGAIVLMRNRPNFHPRVYGYHELWHSLGIAAGACHYAAVLMLVVAAATVAARG